MLSETLEGKMWIEQFDVADRSLAELLLDSIILVDQSEFEGRLESALDRFVTVHGESLALYAAVERPAQREPGNHKKIFDKHKKYFPPIATQKNPSREHEQHISPGSVGSEGDMAHFCRDFASKYLNVFSHPGIEKLRSNRIKHIVCIDDIVGSGNRMHEFIEWLYEDTTIKSWISFGWIKISVVAYAVTEIGNDLIRGMPTVHSITGCRALKFGSSIWSNKERQDLESLCNRYARRFNLGYPLGYKKAFSLILFPNKCPNTNPSIIWNEGNTWIPLVEGMSRPVDLIKKSEPGFNRQDRLLKILGMTTLTKPSLFRRLSPDSKSLITFLACLTMKKRSNEILSEMLGVSYDAVMEFHERAIMLRWIDDQRFVTREGRKALSAAKRNKCVKEFTLVANEDFYYPNSLRSPAN